MKMKIYAKLFAVIFLINQFAFCMPGPIYTASEMNTGAVKVAMAQAGNVAIDIAPFDSNSSIEQPTCRLMVKMSLPQEYSFYIANAFKTELAIGGMLNGNSPVKIKGTLKNMQSSASVYDPYWYFDVELASSNGKTLRVATKYHYHPEWDGDNACDKMKLAVYPATRKLIYDILTNPEFISLVQP